MVKDYSDNWWIIASGDSEVTIVTKITTGWIYSQEFSKDNEDSPYLVTSLYIPDPDHKNAALFKHWEV